MDESGAEPQASPSHRRTLILGAATAIAVSFVGVAAVAAVRTPEPATPPAASTLPSADATTPAPTVATRSSKASPSVAPARKAALPTRASSRPAAKRVVRDLAPVAMPKGDLPGWKQLDAQDFPRTVLREHFLGGYGPGRWVARIGEDTSGRGVFSENDVVSISKGALDLWIRTEKGEHKVAAPGVYIYAHPPAQLYGRYSMRFRADDISGYQASWGLYSEDEKDERILFPAGRLDGTIGGGVYPYGASTPYTRNVKTDATFTGWHVATVNWTPDKVEYFLDGRSVGVDTEVVPNRPMQWFFQTETLTSGPEPSDSASGHARVDWFVQYERK